MIKCFRVWATALLLSDWDDRWATGRNTSEWLSSLTHTCLHGRSPLRSAGPSVQLPSKMWLRSRMDLASGFFWRVSSALLGYWLQQEKNNKRCGDCQKQNVINQIRLEDKIKMNPKSLALKANLLHCKMWICVLQEADKLEEGRKDAALKSLKCQVDGVEW